MFTENKTRSIRSLHHQIEINRLNKLNTMRSTLPTEIHLPLSTIYKNCNDIVLRKLKYSKVNT